MVALQVLVLPVLVRIRIPQRNSRPEWAGCFALRYVHFVLTGEESPDTPSVASLRSRVIVYGLNNYPSGNGSSGKAVADSQSRDCDDCHQYDGFGTLIPFHSTHASHKSHNEHPLAEPDGCTLASDSLPSLSHHNERFHHPFCSSVDACSVFHSYPLRICNRNGTYRVHTLLFSPSRSNNSLQPSESRACPSSQTSSLHLQLLFPHVLLTSRTFSYDHLFSQR